MTTPEMRDERITWLRYELAEAIEGCERGLLDSRQLANQTAHLTTSAELTQLGDELLLHSFWAVQHFYQRPACWAPSPDEMTYLKRCLRDEDLFDPAQVEFSLES